MPGRTCFPGHHGIFEEGLLRALIFFWNLCVYSVYIGSFGRSYEGVIGTLLGRTEVREQQRNGKVSECSGRNSARLLPERVSQYDRQHS